MHTIGKFVLAGFAAASVGMLPDMAAAQSTVVRHDTVVTVRKDTVVHVKEDTAVVTTTVTTNDRVAPGSASIAVTLGRMPNYKTLTALLTEARLMPSLRGSAPMTLFAPTDDAFAKLSPSEMEALKADTTRLRNLLLNTMVSGKIDTREILKLKNATTMRGSRIRFTYRNGMPLVNDQPIVQPGIMASNGFIYGISGVIGIGGGM
jgi:uncharacterized surface protein with fasciclin (FAS1) repeats